MFAWGRVVDAGRVLNQMNQNLYFGCFEILSLFFEILFLFPIIVLGVLFFFLLLFWNIILFPIILILCLGYK